MPIKSLYPDLDLPVKDIFSLVFARKTPFPDNKIVFRDTLNPKRELTFGHLRDKSLSLGKALKEKFQLKQGDVIALFTPNDIDYPIIALAALSVGVIVSPANPTYTVGELSYQLKDCTAKVVLAHYAAIDTVQKACRDCGIKDEQILLLGDKTATKNGIKHYSSLPLSNLSLSQWRAPQIDPKDDLAFLVFSSGTSGRPKGVKLTHFNLASNMLQTTACEAGKTTWDGHKTVKGLPDAPRIKNGDPNSGGDKLLGVLPFFHIYGLNNLVLTPTYNGITVLVMPKFDIEAMCKLIQAEKITMIYIVPPIALALAKHPCVDKYDLSSVRMTNSGAAPLTKETQEAVYKRCGIRIKQGYGLSEVSPTSHEQKWEDWNVKVGTIGRLMPNMECKLCVVADEAAERTGAEPKEVPTGETGEIYLRGPNVFQGYWNNEAATRDCLTEDGWFRTGDVGYVDADGDYFITDRVKELIKVNGFQVAPAELEGYLQQNDLVDDVVVVGVYSQAQGTEVPRAYIVRRGGMKAVQKGDDKKISDWLAARTIGYKRLRGGVKFVETVPKSASGKLLRRLIKSDAQKEFDAEEKAVKAKL